MLITLVLNLLSAFISLLQGDPVLVEVFDSQSNQPVPYVNIRLKNQDLRFTSNSEGKFTLVINPVMGQDTLILTSIGYKTLLFPVRQLSPQKNKLRLQEDIVALNEIVVKPLTAQQIIEKGIKLMADNHFDARFLGQGFYRKAIKEKTAFAFLTEAVVQLSADQGNPNKIRVAHLKSRATPDFRIYKQPLPRDLVTPALEMDHVHYQRGFLNLYNLQNWQFRIVGLTKIDQREIYIIQARLLGNKKTAVHQAKIYIGEADYAFHRIDYDYKWEAADLPDGSDPADSLLFQKYHWQGSFNYIPYKGKMVLNYFHFTLKQHVYAKSYLSTSYGRVKNHQLLTTQEAHEEFIASPFTSSNALKKQANPLRFSQTNVSSYDEPFWRTYKRPVETELFRTIKHDLESHGPYEQLFTGETK